MNSSRRAMLRLTTIFALCSVVVGTSMQAGAIVYGQTDGDAHSNVGSLVVPTGGPPFQTCSGTLIAPKVFLTAAHCLYGFEAVPFAVTFDSTISSHSRLYTGRGVVDPLYTDYKGRGGRSEPHDIAVFLLDDAPAGITPSLLAGPGFLDSRKATLRSSTFVTVGYGSVRETRRGGASGILPNLERRSATSSFLSLENAWLTLSMNQALGNGGTCYGDSGGPHFLDGVLVSITALGDTQCKAIDATYRVDTAAAHEFLAPYL